MIIMDFGEPYFVLISTQRAALLKSQYCYLDSMTLDSSQKIKKITERYFTKIPAACPIQVQD